MLSESPFKGSSGDLNEKSGSAPRVLLITTRRWFAPARLGMALANSGFEVHAVCPHGHPLTKTNAIRRTYPYRGLTPLQSIRAAVRKALPRLVIPCDDLATSHLHLLYETELHSREDGMRTLLENSLGAPSNYSAIQSRIATLNLARDNQIRVPEIASVEHKSDLSAWLESHGFPAVLKTDGSSGGLGVRIIRNPDEAESAHRELSAPPLIARVIKRAIFDKDYSLVLPFVRRTLPVMSVQSFIPGRDACSAIACWKGRLLASIETEVLETWKPRGPAAVVRIIANLEMREAAAKIVCRLGLSGLFGFDFILDDRTGAALLIEINPRATQTAHLTLGPGMDLGAALYSVIAGEPLRNAPRVTDKEVIALFPQQWQNNPSSPLLKNAYHDVPWEESALVRACIESREHEKRWLSYDNWLAIRSKFWSPRR